VAILMIGYELRGKSGVAYDGLFDTIKRIGSGWWHCLDSTWLVITTKTTDQVRDALAPHLGPGDQLMVIAYGKGAAWTGFSDERAYWLSENL